MKSFFFEGGGVGACAIFLFFFLVPNVFKTLGIPLEQKCPHDFYIFFTMIPASTLMEPTKHQGKRNLKTKTVSHFTEFNPLSLSITKMQGLQPPTLRALYFQNAQALGCYPIYKALCEEIS
jgi:hypothetical protein